MAKETIGKDAVTDALRRLKEEETELLQKLKPVQEAIGALEKIVEKAIKKVKPAASKDQSDGQGSEEAADAAE